MNRKPNALIHRTADSDRWHIADPTDGSPLLGEFDSYRDFDSREAAIGFALAAGYSPTFEDEEASFTADAVRVLSRITTRDESGTHYTACYGRLELDALIAEGLLVETRPVHEATGLTYSEEYWSVELTESGQNLVDRRPEYWDERC